MNQNLQDFYQAWWDWFEGGCKHNAHGFDICRGLCYSLHLYGINNGWSRQEIRAALFLMERQFRENHLKTFFPFDEDVKAFSLAEDKTKNPLRTAFVWMHLAPKNKS